MKINAIFGLKTLESRPCRNGDDLRLGRLSARSPLVPSANAEPDEVRGAGEVEERERRGGRVEDRGDSQGGSKGPDEKAGVDAERGGDRRAPPVSDAVLEYECHVGPRYHDDHCCDAGKSEDVMHFTIVFTLPC